MTGLNYPGLYNSSLPEERYRTGVIVGYGGTGDGNTGITTYDARRRAGEPGVGQRVV